MMTEEELGKRPNPPRKYDMNNAEDVKRWFREMEGYLRTEDFLNQGTDRPGRVFAMDGFRQLRVIMYKHAGQ
jgi:hypothetical protein